MSQVPTTYKGGRVVSDPVDGSVTLDIGGQHVVAGVPASVQGVTVDQWVQVAITDRTAIVQAVMTGDPPTPPGAVMMWTTATAPGGWLLCDGSAVSRTTYAALFAAIGTTYGAGDGSTTFNVPNLKGRVPVGRDSGDSSFDTLGETGGAKTHTLTVGEMPAHTHTTALHGSYRVQGTFPSDVYGAVSGGAEGTSSAGSGQAHNNLQPYLVLNFIIRT